jgi:hypothetical protein
MTFSQLVDLEERLSDLHDYRELVVERAVEEDTPAPLTTTPVEADHPARTTVKQISSVLKHALLALNAHVWEPTQPTNWDVGK